MNALPSTLKWLGSGLGLWAAMACSAEASAPPTPSGTGSTQAQGGSNNGSGGSGTALPTAGTTGQPTAGTTSTPQGGSTGVGTAGSTGVGTAGTAAGGMSGGALTSCPVPPAAGTMTDLVIDDMEDGDNGVKRIGGRSGFWYTYLDALGSTIIPKPAPVGQKADPLTPGMTNCHGGMKCILISGATVAGDPTMMMYAYAGVGFDFSNASKPCVYNGSAYTGIKFWIRGDVPVTIKLNTTATADALGGGTCAAECNGGFSPTGADVVLTPDWQQVDINFATAMGPTWVLTPKTLDKASLLSLQIQVPPGQASYSIAIDDVTFY